MASVAASFMLMSLGTIAGILVFMLLMKYRSTLKRLEELLGADFVRTAGQGADGILTAVIANQDVDHLFFPITRRDDRFYYVEFPLPGKKGMRREHFKITKDDVFLLRGRLLFAFLLRDKMRAVNLDLVKTLEILDEEQKQELINDYVEYQALRNQYKNISSEMMRAKTEEDLEKLRRKRQKVIEQMEQIKKKWNIVIGTLEKDKVVLIEDEDDPDYYYVIRTVNFEKFADAMTGVRPNEIYDTAVSMYKRFVMEFLKDWFKAFKIPQGATSGSGMWMLIVAIAFLFIVMMVVRGMGGG